MEQYFFLKISVIVEKTKSEFSTLVHACVHTAAYPECFIFTIYITEQCKIDVSNQATFFLLRMQLLNFVYTHNHTIITKTTLACIAVYSVHTHSEYGSY